MKELNSTADLHRIEWLLSHMKGNKLYMTFKHTGLEIQALIIIDDENFFNVSLLEKCLFSYC